MSLRRGGPPPELAPRVSARSLRLREAQEHLVRRLGQALVLQWDALSDEMQDLLIDQAAIVEDREGGVVSAEEVEAFVRTVTTAALKPKGDSEP